jgi:hypothetical protein
MAAAWQRDCWEMTLMSFPGDSLTWLQRSLWRALWHVGKSSLHAWLAER